MVLSCTSLNVSLIIAVFLDEIPIYVHFAGLLLFDMVQLWPSNLGSTISEKKKKKSDGLLLSFHPSFLYITCLFTSFLCHGNIPECFRACILHLILKPGKDPSVSDNYSPIALAPTLSKVFEWCVLMPISFCNHLVSSRGSQQIFVLV